MKTNTNSNSELKSRSEQLSTPKLARINFARRRMNRSLDTLHLLNLLRSRAPEFFGIAEVVGKWVWIQFAEKQPASITSQLSELGFHWNDVRQAWQHPCGLPPSERATFDPGRGWMEASISTFVYQKNLRWPTPTQMSRNCGARPKPDRLRNVKRCLLHPLPNGKIFECSLHLVDKTDRTESSRDQRATLITAS